MKTTYMSIVITCLAVLLLIPGNDSGASEEKYRIGEGDILFVSVWRDETLSRQLVVQPDGNISFPLIGEIRAAGQTVDQVKNSIKHKLSRYVPDPVLSVGVQQVNSMIIYVIGKVNRPGQYLMNRNISVLQALSMAGGMNAFADENGILILREQDSQTEIYHFDYEDVSEGEDLSQNIKLQRGDVIVVP